MQVLYHSEFPGEIYLAAIISDVSSWKMSYVRGQRFLMWECLVKAGVNSCKHCIIWWLNKLRNALQHVYDWKSNKQRRHVVPCIQLIPFKPSLVFYVKLHVNMLFRNKRVSHLEHFHWSVKRDIRKNNAIRERNRPQDHTHLFSS